MSTGPRSGEPAPRAAHATVLDVDAPAVARSYADALINAADKDGQVEAVVGELEEFLADILDPHPAFAELLTHPATSAEEKDRILDQTLDGRALPVTLRFLHVLNRHGRLAYLREVVRQARAAWDRRQNRRPVTVRSAVPLDEDVQNALRDRLGRMLRAEPVLSLEVDPSLIAGLIVQVGDEVYDASVRNQLRRLRRQLREEHPGHLRDGSLRFTELT